MNELSDGLNVRFNIALQSSKDREFFQSVYYYFEYIYKTPALKAIFDESESKYHKEFGEIWKERKKYTEEELDIKSAEVSKLERFNLYALGCGIEGRVYLPIDDYRNTNESDRDQDPVAVLLMKGFDYAVGLKKWSKENLKRYNRWFDGKRNVYEVELRQFHLMFLEEIAKVKEPIKTQKNSEFYFDTDTGSFRYKSAEGSLSPKSREYQFLEALYSTPSHQATYKELLGNPEIVSKNDKIILTETIKALKRKLNILPKNKNSSPDIIKNISKYGYKLDI